MSNALVAVSEAHQRSAGLALLLSAAGVGLVAGCGDSSSPDPEPYPVVWSWTEPGVRTVSLRFLLPVSIPDCDVDSVTVTGPGLLTALALRCEESRGAAFATDDLDFSHGSPPLPLVYTFQATLDGQTRVRVAEVDCYQPLPTGIAPAPGATVASPVTMRWARAPRTQVEYTVAAFLGGVSQATSVVVDDSDVVLTLPPGDYSWVVSAVPVGLYDGSSERHCGSSWGPGSFTVQ